MLKLSPSLELNVASRTYKASGQVLTLYVQTTETLTSKFSENSGACRN